MDVSLQWRVYRDVWGCTLIVNTIRGVGIIFVIRIICCGIVDHLWDHGELQRVFKSIVRINIGVPSGGGGCGGCHRCCVRFVNVVNSKWCREQVGEEGGVEQITWCCGCLVIVIFITL